MLLCWYPPGDVSLLGSLGMNMVPGMIPMGLVVLAFQRLLLLFRQRGDLTDQEAWTASSFDQQL